MSLNDTALALIQAGAMVSTFAFVFSRGLRTQAADLGFLFARPGLLLRSLASVDALVPLIALTIVVLIHPAEDVAVGLLLLSASPAAPMVLKRIAEAGGNSDYAVSLHVALASIAIFTTPALLELLSIAAGFNLGIHPLMVAAQVGLSILLPLAAGLIIARRFPATAGRMVRLLEAFSDLVFLLVVILVLISFYHLLLAMDIRSYVAMALTITGAFGAGHLMAWGRREEQTTLALESATRNVGLALLIASTFTTMENALPVIIPYIVISAIIGLIYVRYRKIGVKSARR